MSKDKSITMSIDDLPVQIVYTIYKSIIQANVMMIGARQE